MIRRRTAGLVIGVLAVVCIGLILSVLSPLSTIEPHQSAPPDERFRVPDAQSFSTSGRILADGTERLGFEGVVASDGAWYQRVREPGVRSEQYKPANSSTIYHRVRLAGHEDIERFRAEVADDENRRLIRVDTAGKRTSLVIVVNTTHPTEPVTGTASVFVHSLAVAGYEATRTRAAGATLHEPRAGWYDGETPYHLTKTAGAASVNTTSHAVLSANVTWEQTVPAGTYLQFVLARLAGAEPTTKRITYHFDATASPLECPDWLNATEVG